jgi:hypothetical protein
MRNHYVCYPSPSPGVTAALSKHIEIIQALRIHKNPIQKLEINKANHQGDNNVNKIHFSPPLENLFTPDMFERQELINRGTEFQPTSKRTKNSRPT